MNKNVTVETDGLKIEGELLATREEFYFTVWSVVEIATGRTFEDIDKANEALDLSLDAETLAREAAQQCGISYHDLLDMSHRFDPIADRNSRI